MSNKRDPDEVRDETHLESILETLPRKDDPAILLSAGVPYVREGTPDMTLQERAQQRERSNYYVGIGQPVRIRSAVLAFTTTALRRGVRLIFGAQDAISSMVLVAARDAGARPDSILIFQSAHFAGRLPSQTLQLADWAVGRMIFTQGKPGHREFEARTRSLMEMRTMMVSPSTLRGAVFVGGMDGVEEEAQLFRQKHPRLPRYALASTGSAAQDLFRSGPSEYAGTLQDPGLLETCPSYPLLAGLILDDMGIFAPPAHGQFG